MSDIELGLVPTTLGGREVKVLQPELSKLALLQRQSRILTSDNVSKEQGLRAMDLAYRIVLGSFPDPEDLEHVENLIADGDITLAGLVSVITGTLKQAAEEQAAESKPAVRRGRPRKQA